MYLNLDELRYLKPNTENAFCVLTWPRLFEFNNSMMISELSPISDVKNIYIDIFYQSKYVYLLLRISMNFNFHIYFQEYILSSSIYIVRIHAQI